MSNTLTDETFAGMQARSTAYQSAFDQGVLIGRRDMKPLIRELIEALGDYVQLSDWDFELDMLVVKAKAEVEALENA